MDGYYDSPGTASNETLIYPTSDAVMSDSPTFDFYFELVSAVLLWVLFLAHGGVGLYHYLKGTWRFLLRWPLYFMMAAYIVAAWLCENLALIFTIQVQHGTAGNGLYLVYIFFWHAQSALFLSLLLALSSGYCITRPELAGLERVYLIPGVVFIAGVAADFTFVYVESTQHLSAAADRYQFAQMTPFESVVWVVGSLANIMCFILSWVVIFDSIQLEIKELDDQQAVLQGRVAGELDENGQQPGPGRGRRIDDSDGSDDDGPADADDDAPVNPLDQRNGGHHRPRAERPLGRASARQELLQGLPDSAGARQGDVEGGREGAEKETFADHVQYTVRKTLLMRFYFGVCAYLLVSIMVIMLPAFFNTDVMNAIVVLQFAVKLAFTVMLAWFFRPARDSPYLQIGLSDADADNMGVSQLDTELVVTEHARPRSGPAAAPAAGAPPTAGLTALAPAAGSQPPAPKLPISKPPGLGDGGAAAEAVAARRQQLKGAPGAQQSAGHLNGQKSQFTLDDEEE